MISDKLVIWYTVFEDVITRGSVGSVHPRGSWKSLPWVSVLDVKGIGSGKKNSPKNSKI